MAIVHYAHRPKRPPRKRKLVALPVPAVVAKRSRRRSRGKAAAEVMSPPSIPEKAEEGAAQRSTSRAGERIAPKPSIVATGAAPDLTLEEHRRRGDAADALFRDMVRAIKDRP